MESGTVALNDLALQHPHCKHPMNLKLLALAIAFLPWSITLATAADVNKQGEVLCKFEKQTEPDESEDTTNPNVAMLLAKNTCQDCDLGTGSA